MSRAEPRSYDAIIIGTGQGGKPLARALGQAGWKTAIVEKDHVGGSCINYGCTPTKTMVASARVAYLARRAADYGVDVGSVRVDLDRVVRRKRKVVERFREGSRRSLETTAGVDLNLVMSENGMFIEIQGTAERVPFTDEQLQQMLSLGRKGCLELIELQKQVLDL